MDQAQHLATSRHNLTDEAYQTERHLAARCLYDHQTPTWDLPALASGLIAGHRPHDILEVGCGDGLYVEKLRSDFPRARVIAADLSKSIMQGIEDPRVVADIHALPFSDHSFDAVLAMHMLYYVPDIPQAITELARLCRPGGLTVVSTVAEQDKAEIDALWAKASALVNGRPIPTQAPRMAPLGFTLDNAPDLLRKSFTEVQSADMQSRITLTHAAPLLAHLESQRSFIDLSDAEFAETLNTARMLAEGQIAERGMFTTNCHVGFVVARQPR